MADRIVIEGTKREEIPVSLVGVDYLVTPPKGITGIHLAEQVQKSQEDPLKSWELLMKWVATVFGKKQTAAIKKRLNDPEDLLDIEHIMALVTKITEASTGTPTT